MAKLFEAIGENTGCNKAEEAAFWSWIWEALDISQTILEKN